MVIAIQLSGIYNILHYLNWYFKIKLNQRLTWALSYNILHYLNW